jgi:hypothetical protein
MPLNMSEETKQLTIPIKVDRVVRVPTPQIMEPPASVMIPVKPAVKKWMLARWGADGKIHVASKNMIGQLMLNLDLDHIDYEPDGEATELIEVTFALRNVQWAYNHKKPQILAGKFMWSQFALAMLTWVDAQVQAGRQALESLEDFLAEHDILEEDYDRDSAYRYWLKYRPRRISDSEYEEMHSKSA